MNSQKHEVSRNDPGLVLQICMSASATEQSTVQHFTSALIVTRGQTMYAIGLHRNRKTASSD